MAITFDELFAFVKSERRLQYKCVVLFVYWKCEKPGFSRPGGFFFFSARIAYQIVCLVCRNEPFDQLVEIKNGIS